MSLGTWMDEVTRGWLIYSLTDSALQLGLVRGIQAVPFLLLSPVAGSIADRYSRKNQMAVAQIATGLVYAATALLILTGQIQPWHVYVTSFLMAFAQTFQQPARAAVISEAVPLVYLTNAIGLNAMIYNVARIVGPALAGLLIVLSGTGGAYGMQAVFLLLATLWTLQMQLPPRSAGSGEVSGLPPESFGRSIIEGWKFSWHNEIVRTGLMVAMNSALFLVPFITILPVFARDLLKVGASGQGLLLTAMGIGALCSATLIASAGDKLPRGMLMLGHAVLYGFSILGFAASPWFRLSLVMMAFTGLCHVHSNALAQTVVQSYSPNEFRGRIMAIFFMNRVVVTVGSMLIGTLSALWGARWALAVMGTLGALAVVTIFMVLPRARLIR